MNNKYNLILEQIEIELSRILPNKSTLDWVKNVSGGISTDISTQSADIINEPAIDLIYRGGKRWRPLVLVLTALNFKADKDLALKLSPFVELIHNGTLLIDDIEDNAIERRGKKAIHLIYGEDMAINSGNHLYFMPTTIIDDLKIDNELKLRIYKSYTHNMRRLHFGQGLDIQWHKNLNKIPTFSEYIQMCKFKTGCLASMSGELGAILANLSEEKTEEIRVIWENIGVSFQILDDIKNITTGNPGKLRGDDIVEGKKSLPIILFCNSNNNSVLLKNISKAKKYGIKKGQKFVENSIKILENSGCIKEGKEIALDMLNTSIKELDILYNNNPEKDLIINLVKSFINNVN